MILARQEEKKRKTPEEEEGLSLLLAEVADREKSMKELRMGVNTMQLQLAACITETHQNVEGLREKNSLLELREKAIKKEAEQLEQELSKTRKQLEVAANALSSGEVKDCEARAVIEAANAQRLKERGAGKLERLRLELVMPCNFDAWYQWAEKENRIRKVCKSIAARMICDNATLFLIRWRDAMYNQRRLKRAQGKIRQVIVCVVN